jgi:hypothetical protein
VIHAYQVPTVIEHTPATQGVHGLGHHRSTSVNEIGDILLSERYLQSVAMWARGSKHHGEVSQGFNEPRFDPFGEKSDQLPFCAFLPTFEFGAEEAANSGLSTTRLFKSSSVILAT